MNPSCAREAEEDFALEGGVWSSRVYIWGKARGDLSLSVDRSDVLALSAAVQRLPLPAAADSEHRKWRDLQRGTSDPDSAVAVAVERMVSPAETPGFTRPVMDERHLVYGQMQRDETPGHAPRPGSEGTLLWEIQARTLLNSRPHKCVSHKTMEVIHKMTGRVCLGSRLAGTQMWQEPKNDSCPKSWLANMFRRKLDITILYIYIYIKAAQPTLCDVSILYKCCRTGSEPFYLLKHNTCRTL